MRAAFVGAAGVCKALIEAGADVSRKDKTALSADALLRAAQEHHVNVSSILMDHGASPNACTSSHGVNGVWMSLNSDTDCALNVVHLLSRGMSASCVNSVTGWSALHISAARGQHDSILPLIDYKADVTPCCSSRNVWNRDTSCTSWRRYPRERQAWDDCFASGGAVWGFAHNQMPS
jgi:ankyrin repeat protein